MGQNGADVLLSAAAKQAFPFSVECKSIARFAGYAYLEQATGNKGSDGLVPIAVVKGNRKHPLVLIGLDDFFKLLEHGN